MANMGTEKNSEKVRATLENPKERLNNNWKNINNIPPAIITFVNIIAVFLASIIGARIGTKGVIDAIDHEAAYTATAEFKKTATRQALLTSAPTITPTPTVTPAPTLTPTPAANMGEYIAYLSDMNSLYGQTDWRPANPGLDGNNYWWTNNTERDINNFALWCPVIPQDGMYQIEVFVPDKKISNDVANIVNSVLSERAIYNLVKLKENEDGLTSTHADEIEQPPYLPNDRNAVNIERIIMSIEFNQEMNADGSWHKLDGFIIKYFKDDTNPCIKLSDKTSDLRTRIIVFDAIRWVFIP
jgi:hypothetical protein